MHGPFRVPTLIKAADSACRAALVGCKSKDSPLEPFEWNQENAAWLSYWREEDISIVVSGDTNGPTRALYESVVRLIERFDVVERDVTEFASEAKLAHQRYPRPIEPFSGMSKRTLRGCFVRLEATNEDDPKELSLTFYTGSPDGYFLYEAILRNGVPIDLRIGFW